MSDEPKAASPDAAPPDPGTDDGDEAPAPIGAGEDEPGPRAARTPEQTPLLPNAADPFESDGPLKDPEAPTSAVPGDAPQEIPEAPLSEPFGPADSGKASPPARDAGSLESEADDASGRHLSFMDHLLELRSRLVIAAVAIVLATVLSLVFFETIFHFLRGPMEIVNEKFRASEAYRELLKAREMPLDEPVIRPISVNPLGLMLILMKVSIWAGLVLSSPVVLFELWRFVAPGLNVREKRAIRPVLVGGVFAFLAGAAFCYYVVFPFTLEFLVWLDVYLGYRPSYPPQEYMGLLLTFMLIFGAVFEIPLVAAVLAKLRILHPSVLTRFWRYVILACFIMGSVFSPGGEVISMLLMTGSLLFLYLVSIVLTRLMYPRD